MKKYLIILLLSLTFCFFAEENALEKTKIKMDKYTILQTVYYSECIFNGVYSLINTFAHFGYAYQVGEDFLDFSQKMKDSKIGNYQYVENFANSYAYIIFGSHFVLSGISFIPVAGGLSYGVGLLAGGIALSVLSFYKPSQFFGLDEAEVYEKGYTTKLKAHLDNIFDPASLYATGIIAVIFGIAEVITYKLYNDEAKRRKYPYFKRQFSFHGNYFTLRLGS